MESKIYFTNLKQASKYTVDCKTMDQKETQRVMGRVMI